MLMLDATHGGVSTKQLTTVRATLDDYRKHLADTAKRHDTTVDECSVVLPQCAERLALDIDVRALRYVVVIGIGGSNLGAMAVYDALFGRYDALRARQPKMLFLDTVSTTALRAVESALLRCASAEEFVVFVISKSGTTTESIANAETLYTSLAARFPDAQSQFVAITCEGSKLSQRAETLKMRTVAIPRMVGGRFSVFTPVGLAPLALVGVDVANLLEGARKAVRDCTAEGETNPALVSAAHTFLHAGNGKAIHNSFLFDPDLEGLGKWYRQLMGESIGKSHDVGVTPMVSIGSTDLHSMSQLYLGGPNDKFTNIITRPAPDDDAVLGESLLLSGLVDHIEKKSFGTIMSAIVGGVTAAYIDTGLPFLAMHMQDRSASTIGYFLQMRMIEIMYLAKLFNVNAFDQPAVELYKKGARALLA